MADLSVQTIKRLEKKGGNYKVATMDIIHAGFENHSQGKQNKD